MAKGNARGASRRGAGGGSKIPGWLWLFTGVALGLFLGFLVFLNKLQQQPKQTDDSIKSEQKATVKNKVDKSLPKFDFYAVLPKMEVILPREDETEVRPSGKKIPPSTSNTATKGPEKAAAAPGEQGKFMLQAGSFRNSADAERLRAEYTLDGFNVRVQPGVLDNGDTWYRVMIGPFSNKTDLRNAQTRLAVRHVDALPIQIKE